MSKECFVRKVLMPNGISMFDGCGTGRPITISWRLSFLTAVCPVNWITWNDRNELFQSHNVCCVFVALLCTKHFWCWHFCRDWWVYISILKILCDVRWQRHPFPLYNHDVHLKYHEVHHDHTDDCNPKFVVQSHRSKIGWKTIFRSFSLRIDFHMRSLYLLDSEYVRNVFRNENYITVGW